MLAALLAGCGPAGGTGAAPASPTGGAGAASGLRRPAISAPSFPPGQVAGPSSAAGLVAVIVMENQSPPAVLAKPHLSALARGGGAILDNYSSVGHPSLPNYLALTSGKTWDIQDDGYHPLPAGQDLGHQLAMAKIPWRAYMESMRGGCLDSPRPYALKHNPFAYYGGGCPPEVVPLDGLERDLSAPRPPRFIWITPNLCNDDHDCPPEAGDNWLGVVVPRLQATPAFAQHGLIAVVWDEGSGGADATPAVIFSPDVTSDHSQARYDHYSLLAAIEDRLGLARLGHAAEADPLRTVLGELRLLAGCEL